VSLLVASGRSGHYLKEANRMALRLRPHLLGLSGPDEPEVPAVLVVLGAGYS
jgi:hypothetical protein